MKEQLISMKKEIPKRGGASGIMMAKSDSILTLASVGSCVAYHYRNGVMTKIFVELHKFCRI